MGAAMDTLKQVEPKDSDKSRLFYHYFTTNGITLTYSGGPVRHSSNNGTMSPSVIHPIMDGTKTRVILLLVPPTKSKQQPLLFVPVVFLLVTLALL
jgi:hypothetical protein